MRNKIFRKITAVAAAALMAVSGIAPSYAAEAPAQTEIQPESRTRKSRKKQLQSRPMIQRTFLRLKPLMCRRSWQKTQTRILMTEQSN